MSFFSKLFGGGSKTPNQTADEVFFQAVEANSFTLGGDPIEFRGLTLSLLNNRGRWTLNVRAQPALTGMHKLKGVELKVFSTDKPHTPIMLIKLESFSSVVTGSLPPSLQEGDIIKFERISA